MHGSDDNNTNKMQHFTEANHSSWHRSGTITRLVIIQMSPWLIQFVLMQIILEETWES